jgi:RNA polymerase sigma-70 factor (ECF subfamily)
MSTDYTLDKKKKTLLEQLYYQYRYLMFHIALGILEDYDLAEDAVHTAFLKLAKSNIKIDDILNNKTKTFMVIVVRGTAIDVYNKIKNDSKNYPEEKMLEIAYTEPSPLELAISNKGIDRIKKALQTMDPKYADVIILKYFYDFSNKEISTILSISEQTVRVRLHRAKKILASELNKGSAGHEKV